MAEEREHRRFDLEADFRNRRFFLLLMTAFAVLAMLGGILAAYWILMGNPDVPPPPPPKPKPPDEVQPIEPLRPIFGDDDDGPPEPKPTPKQKKSAPTDTDINRGLARLQSAFNHCARQHGGLTGARIGVDFRVEPGGRASKAFARNPYTQTPLGRCIARVILEQGRFPQTVEGMVDIRRDIVLDPEK